jgi:hypothetical protein
MANYRAFDAQRYAETRRISIGSDNICSGESSDSDSESDPDERQDLCSTSSPPPPSIFLLHIHSFLTGYDQTVSFDTRHARDLVVVGLSEQPVRMRLEDI